MVACHIWCSSSSIGNNAIVLGLISLILLNCTQFTAKSFAFYVLCTMHVIEQKCGISSHNITLQMHCKLVSIGSDAISTMGIKWIVIV